MEQLNLPITDLYGNKLPESDYMMDKVLTNDIRSIEFFPDYCATGIWITEKSDGQYHTSASFDDLELQFPQWFKNKVKAMQMMFDHFADSGTHEEDYGFTFDENDSFMFKCIKIIEADFIDLYPELIYLLIPYSNKLPNEI